MHEPDYEFISEACDKGVSLLEQGVTDRKKWSRAMFYKFGEAIVAHLDLIWISAQEERQRRQAAIITEQSEASHIQTTGSPDPTTDRVPEQGLQTPLAPKETAPLRQPNTSWFSRHRLKLIWLCVGAVLVGFAILWVKIVEPRKEQQSQKPVGVTEQTNQKFSEADFEAVEETGPKKQESAIDRLRKAAEQGDAEAQHQLGLLYYHGQGVSQNHAEAANWFEKAASQGVANAQCDLGECFFLGLGVQRDEQRSSAWTLEAAKAGLPRAQFIMGTMYREGVGVPRDYSEAAKWHAKAAEQGIGDAQVELGKLYHSGLGVPQNLRRAAEMFRRAADQGNAYGQTFLGDCYWNGNGVAQDYAQAAYWTRRAAEQGYALAQGSLGVHYSHGKGVPQNDIEAYKWYSLAAAQDDKNRKWDDSVAKSRDLISPRMARAEIVEGQRRAAMFVAKKEMTVPTWEDSLPLPEIGEAKVFAGTGFFVSDDGYLVTCEHVVRGATSFRVTTAGRSVAAKLIKLDKTLDVALLKVNGTFQALPVAAEPRVKLGAGVFTIGFPNPDVQGVEPKLTRGEISSMAGMRDSPRHFQISVPVQPGNSGGALVDENGNVVGVVVQKLSVKLNGPNKLESGELPENVNYAIKGGLVYNFLSKVPELAGKLKSPHTSKDRGAANIAAERAAVLVVAE